MSDAGAWGREAGRRAAERRGGGGGGQEDPPPIAYPPGAILNPRQLAAWLQVSERAVEGWPLPRLRLPGKLVRYSAGQVLAYLEGRAPD